MKQWTAFFGKRLGGCLASGFGNGLGWFLGFYIAYKMSGENIYQLLDHALTIWGSK